MTDIKKAHQLLTITKATAQARRLVDKLMPGVGTTVESKGSWDLDTDTAIMITTVTFPANDIRGMDLYNALCALPNRSGPVRVGSASFVITRER